MYMHECVFTLDPATPGSGEEGIGHFWTVVCARRALSAAAVRVPGRPG